MYLDALFVIASVIAFFVFFLLIPSRLYAKEKAIKDDLIQKNKDLSNDLADAVIEIDNLKKSIKQQSLSIEADQILHDMTRYGHSIVRIMPISPTDVFWRSPS